MDSPGDHRGRVPPLKMLASAITIGTGGAAGREGLIALVMAGFGSVYATARRRSDDERRLLVPIGMEAGLAAIFRSPIGASVFAIEVLYNDTVASGGSGGVFAPTLFVGAMLGGSLAQLVQLPPAVFVVVGMAAVFGGAARVPFATLLNESDIQHVAVIRQGEMLFPASDPILQTGDQVLVMARSRPGNS